VPCFHPWSIRRVDPRALHVRLILSIARQAFTVASCTDVYRHLAAHRGAAEGQKG
jgi:hypothetical protein